jgi:cobalt-zinc-cadmium efflux system membrane fusion protein
MSSADNSLSKHAIWTRVVGCLAIGLVSLSLVACSTSSASKRDDKQVESLPTIQLTAEMADKLNIKTEKIEKRVVTDALHVTGQIKPDVGKEVNVNTRFSGRIVAVKVDLGQVVHPGDVVALVDSREIAEMQAEMIESQSKLQIAMAQEKREQQVYEEQLRRPTSLISAQTRYEDTKVQLDLSKSDHERLEGLYREKIAAAKDFFAARASLAKAQTAHAQAVAELDREKRLYANKALMKKDVELAKAQTKQAKQHLTTLQQRLIFLGVNASTINQVLTEGQIHEVVPIVSPATGVVSQIRIAVGEVLGPEKTAFTITDLTTVVVSADIPEVDFSKVKYGSPVTIQVVSYPDQVYHSTIDYIGERVNEETRTVGIRVKLDNPHYRLKSNMFAELDIETEPRTLLACPKSALQDYHGRKVVFVKTTNGFQERPVAIGTTHGGYLEVLSGLIDGEEVVTDGAVMLKTQLTYKQAS